MVYLEHGEVWTVPLMMVLAPEQQSTRQVYNEIVYLHIESSEEMHAQVETNASSDHHMCACNSKLPEIPTNNCQHLWLKHVEVVKAKAIITCQTLWWLHELSLQAPSNVWNGEYVELQKKGVGLWQWMKPMTISCLYHTLEMTLVDCSRVGVVVYTNRAHPPTHQMISEIYEIVDNPRMRKCMPHMLLWST